MEKMFSELCTPAKIYILLETIVIVLRIFMGSSFMSIVMNVVFVLLWTYVLGWICKKGFKIISWILVLVPLLVLPLLQIKHTTTNKSTTNKSTTNKSTTNKSTTNK
jgi:hypothetical protein